MYYLGQQGTLFAGCNLIDHIPKVNGFYSLDVREEAELRAMLYSYTNTFAAGLADFLAVAQISSDDNIFSWLLRANPSRPVTAGQRAIIAHPQCTIVNLANLRFDGRSVVYLPSEAGGMVTVTYTTTAYSLQQNEATVEADKPCWIVASQAYDPEWQAFANDRSARVWRANHAFQAMEVPAGANRVRLACRDRFFRSGTALSVSSFVVCFACWWRNNTRNES